MTHRRDLPRFANVRTGDMAQRNEPYRPAQAGHHPPRREIMILTISEDWCLRMAELEGNAEIGAGRLALDPTFDGEQSTADGEMLKPRAGIEQRSNLLATAMKQRIVLLKKAIEMSQDCDLIRYMEKRLAEAQNDLRTLIEKDQTND